MPGDGVKNSDTGEDDPGSGGGRARFAAAESGLYGSRARGGARPGSDVDVAVNLRADLSATQRWRKRLEHADALACAPGTDDVDVVLLEEAPAALGHRVVRDGLLVVDRDPQRRVQVVEEVLRRYLDETALRATCERCASCVRSGAKSS